MSRIKFIAGNWKENLTLAEAKALIADLSPLVAGISNVEIAVCPTFLALTTVGGKVAGTNIQLGAQNAHAVEVDGKLVQSGAYTGEVSPAMVKDAGAQWVILGHSERRQYFGETDESVNVKIRACYEVALKPIVCVGETLEERESGTTAKVIEKQVRTCFKGLPADKVAESVVAYEPVWAIGTGKTATPEMAQEVHGLIRALLAEMFGPETANAVRIQYGGSMKPGNAKELLAQPDIDGGLIGGAALKAADFSEIIKAAV
ncbi:MAG: triose-phosphate isomerase [Candidatus Sumerlaeia bacterium]|nr:triose-phosphate isomerase [Candidatus Sumerlaeia bacterium]